MYILYQKFLKNANDFLLLAKRAKIPYGFFPLVFINPVPAKRTNIISFIPINVRMIGTTEVAGIKFPAINKLTARMVFEQIRIPIVKIH